jgi:CRISPR/Cas system CSM-associated protein Csm2 small subunit
MQSPAGGQQRQPGAEYLSRGYFDEKKYLRAEYLQGEGMDAAQWLASASTAMTAAQLRRFFNKMRAVERKLEVGGDFEAVKADIVTFQRDAVYAIGRKVVPDILKTIIDTNVSLALQSERAFKEGFISQFETIVAYFVYRTRYNRPQ